MSERDIRSRVDDLDLVERRRSQITAVAVELFSERGFHGATIRDVAERAGVSVGLIYQYFGDKEDLLYLAILQILDSYMREIPAALEGRSDPLQRLDAAVRAYARVLATHRDAARLSLRETHALSRQRIETIKERELETNRLIGACVAECVAAGVFRDVDVELVTYHCVVFCQGWPTAAWRFGRRLGIDDYVTRGLRLLLTGVLAPGQGTQPKGGGLVSAAAD